MSCNEARGSAEERAGNGRETETAADAADVAGAGGPQAAVHDRRQQPHRHARRGEIDLRQAISQANTNGGAETIAFDKTVFKTPQTINLTGGQLELSDTTGTETIVGPTAGVTVSGGGPSRVFQVDAGVTASISGLTITGGKPSGNGGGLYNDGGNVTLTNCTISGNSAGTNTFTAAAPAIQRERHDHADQLHHQRQFRCLRRRRPVRLRGHDDADQRTVSGNSAAARAAACSPTGAR